jgi:hypothetical protein
MSAFDNYDDWLKQQQGGVQGGGAFSNYPPAQGAQTPTPSPLTTSAPPGPQAPGGAGQGPQAASPGAPSWLPGSQTLSDMTRTFQDAMTFGGADYATAKVGAALHSLLGLPSIPDVDQMRAQTAAASAALPLPLRVAAEGAGYAMGPGAGAEALGLRSGAGLLGGAWRGALEGGAAGGLGAWGHGDNPIVGTAEGLAGGAAGGALASSVLNPLSNWGATKLGQATGALNAPGAITSAAKGVRDDAYDALKDVTYEPTLGPDALMPALQGIKNGVSAIDPAGNLSANSRSVAALDALIGRTASPANKTQTAESILSTIDKVSGYQGPMGGAENDIAPVIKTGLQNYLQNANPTSAHSAGDALDLIQAAKDAHQTYKNALSLQNMSQSLAGFGQSPGPQAQKLAETWYNDPSSPEYQALSKIANAGGGGMGAYNVMHMIDPVLGYVGASMGGGPGALAGEIAGHAMKPTIGSILTAGQRRATQGAISDAYQPLVGQSGPRITPNAGNALLALMFGAGSAGQWLGQ